MTFVHYFACLICVLLLFFLQCLSLLLKRVPKGEADELDHDRMTSLHWSASYGNEKHVKLLLKAGANVTLTDSQS